MSADSTPDACRVEGVPLCPGQAPVGVLAVPLSLARVLIPSVGRALGVKNAENSAFVWKSSPVPGPGYRTMKGRARAQPG